MPVASIPPVLGQARLQFLELVAALRPELHRYCTRITGSVIDGEDVVQDVLAKVYYEMSQSAELQPLRPWLFRVAHNAAIDFCRRHENSRVDSVSTLPERAWVDESAPELVRAALSSFLVLPARQRSAVILKDVLGFSLDEIAAAMETTVPAVKSALVRGRAQLREQAHADAPVVLSEDASARREELARLHRYVSLFNARDWDGVRGLLADECRLDLVSQARRQGSAVGGYFARYAEDRDLRLAPVVLEGQPALAVFSPTQSDRPQYFILITWAGEEVSLIRDFRYVPYLVDGAQFEPVASP